MYKFILNGELIETNRKVSLLTYLREERNLVSVKNGCASGGCGTCMVLVGGKAVKACTLTTEKVAGMEFANPNPAVARKNQAGMVFANPDGAIANINTPMPTNPATPNYTQITTLEGLPPREKAIYAYAFSRTAAIQCGFCTPGMMMSAKALIDISPNPNIKEIKQAIRGNICRCTGYGKIIEAILLAGRILRGEELLPPDFQKELSPKLDPCLLHIPQITEDLPFAEYVDDMKIEGMLYGAALRTKYPRAKIINIDTKNAKAHPDAICVLTAKDLPGSKKIGHIVQDWDVLVPIDEITHYVGDAIALIASKKQESLKEILNLIEVEYEELTPVKSPEDALEKNAPLIHPNGNILSKEKISRGNAQKALENSKHVVSYTFNTPFTEHAFLEPEAAFAMPSRLSSDFYTGDNSLITIYSSDQGVFQTRKECAMALGFLPEQVRVIAKTVGGGFGGKEDMSLQHHAAILSMHTNSPVKMVFSRDESIKVHPKRHKMELEFTVGCDENGILQGLKGKITADTGAYASLGGPILQRACTHAAGPYNFHNIEIEGMAVYTNNPPAGAFRGFGVSQSCFAMESCLDKLAEQVEITPFEIRYINAIKPGDILPNGQIAGKDTALLKTLDAVKEKFFINKNVGIACAIKNSGIGVGLQDIGRVRLVVKNEKIHIRTSAACMGQGIANTMSNIVAEVTGIPKSKIIHDAPDTNFTPNSGNSTASRQTVFTGEATKIAAMKLLERMNVVQAQKAFRAKKGTTPPTSPIVQNTTSDQKNTAPLQCLTLLDGEEFYGEYSFESDPITSQKPNPVSHVAYSYATHIVILDDNGKIEKIIAAHDVGRSINKQAVEGQIEGGVVMSMGYALTENFPLENCVPKAKFATLGLLRSTDIPEIIPIIVENENNGPAFGAKGIGEIASIPTAPAITLAYYHYDGEFRTSLPIKIEL